MIGTKENFFIKEGYQTNPVTTVEAESGDYWNDFRLEITKVYQWYTYQRALELFKEHRFKTVADIGCGPAYKTRLFFDGVADPMYLVDQPTMKDIIAKNYPNGVFQPVNLETGDWVAPKKLDMVINSDVIEHLGDPSNLIRIIKQNMNVGGLVVFSTPERDYRRGKQSVNSPNAQHVREWNQAEFRAYLESEGFTILEHFFDPPKKIANWKYSLSKSLYKWVRNKHWSACQTVICKLS